MCSITYCCALPSCCQVEAQCNTRTTVNTSACMQASMLSAWQAQVLSSTSSTGHATASCIQGCCMADCALIPHAWLTCCFANLRWPDQHMHGHHCQCLRAAHQLVILCSKCGMRACHLQRKTKLHPSQTATAGTCRQLLRVTCRIGRTCFHHKANIR